MYFHGNQIPHYKGWGVDDCQQDRPISDTHTVYFRDGRRLISLVKLVKLSNIYADGSHSYSDNK